MMKQIVPFRNFANAPNNTQHTTSVKESLRNE